MAELTAASSRGWCGHRSGAPFTCKGPSLPVYH